MAVTHGQIEALLLLNSAGVPIALIGGDGREYLLPTLTINTTAQAQPSAIFNNAVAITGGAISGTTVAATTLSASAAVTLSPANASVVLSPTGTGIVTIAPTTAGTMNNVSVGVTTPAVVKASDFQANRTDISGTPGNGTANTPRGRAAIAVAAVTAVITCSLVTANSTVIVQLGGTDATLISIRVTAAAGSFTVTGNAMATAATPFDFIVIN